MRILIEYKCKRVSLKLNILILIKPVLKHLIINVYLTRNVNRKVDKENILINHFIT